MKGGDEDVLRVSAGSAVAEASRPVGTRAVARLFTDPGVQAAVLSGI
jgi:hypothetical protein